MTIIFSDFDDLTPVQIEQLFNLRQRVFILEQQCFYEDIDGLDGKAQHLLFYEAEKLIAYLRLFQPGTKFDQAASLGRIVVDTDYRGTEIGPKLIRKGIELCKGVSVRIEAQSALIDYYHQFGFQKEGEVYLVDGISHIQMVLS